MNPAIALPSVMTADVVVAAKARLLQSMQVLTQGQAVVLDAAAVESFDSAGLALLLALRRAAAEQGRSVQVTGWPASLQSLAQIYGVLPLLEPHAAAAQA